MNSDPAKFCTAASEASMEGLHERILGLGSPAYFHHSSDNTFSVTVTIPTSLPAVTASLKSGYGHATLKDAMRRVLEIVDEGKAALPAENNEPTPGAAGKKTG